MPALPYPRDLHEDAANPMPSAKTLQAWTEIFAQGWSGGLRVDVKVGLTRFPVPRKKFVQADLWMIGDRRHFPDTGQRDDCPPKARQSVGR